MNLPALLCLLAVAGVAAVSCQKAMPPPAAAAPARATMEPLTRKTAGGSFTVTIRPRGGRMARGEHFSLEVLVEPSPGVGAPVSVAVDAEMPAHRHGMTTTPQTVHEGGARYRADGMLFHMAGEWSIAVAVSAGTGEERASFPVTIE